MSPTLPTPGSSSLDLRSTADPETRLSFPACRTVHTTPLPAGRTQLTLHRRYSLNGGIKTVPVPYLPADTARSVSSTSEYGQPSTSRTPSRHSHRPRAQGPPSTSGSNSGSRYPECSPDPCSRVLQVQQPAAGGQVSPAPGVRACAAAGATHYPHHDGECGRDSLPTL